MVLSATEGRLLREAADALISTNYAYSLARELVEEARVIIQQTTGWIDALPQSSSMHILPHSYVNAMQLFLKKTNGVPPAAPPAAPPAVADQQYILIDYSINNPEFEFHNGMYELLQDLQGRDLKH
ncbi:unnamed protein product, partial [marine sediment metagenome]